MSSSLEQIENRELEHGVVEIHRLHLVHGDSGDERGVGMRLGIGRVEPVLVLHVDHGLAPERLGQQVAAGVGPVGRDEPLGGDPHPHLVGRHASEDDGPHLGQIQRNGRKPRPFDGGNPVLGEEVPEHGGVLACHCRTDLGQYPRGEAEIGGDRIEVPGPGAGTGPDQQLVILPGGDDLVHEWVDGRPTPVDHALTTDLDHGGVGEDPVLGRCIGGP